MCTTAIIYWCLYSISTLIWCFTCTCFFLNFRDCRSSCAYYFPNLIRWTLKLHPRHVARSCNFGLQWGNKTKWVVEKLITFACKCTQQRLRERILKGGECVRKLRTRAADTILSVEPDILRLLPLTIILAPVFCWIDRSRDPDGPMMCLPNGLVTFRSMLFGNTILCTWASAFSTSQR